MLNDPNLESLAVADLSIDLGTDRLSEIADLVLRRHQSTARRNGALLTHAQQRTYAELRETEQLGMRSAVLRVVEALVLLDVVALR
jgi:hypothetical protein